MALKTFKPYTKSVRGTILVDRKNLWKGKPFKPLTSVKNSSSGRNNLGRITARNVGGGHKQKYRNIDFYRKKFGEKAEVERIEYDPNRSCHIMLVKFSDGERYYYLPPPGFISTLCISIPTGISDRGKQLPVLISELGPFDTLSPTLIPWGAK